MVQVATSGTTNSRTVYVGLGGTGKSMYKRTTTGATVQHTNFIYAGGAHGGNAFALRVMANDGTTSTTTTRYMSFDHLGSTTAVSDEKGHIAGATGADTELLGYDPWGARRNPDGQPPSASSTFSPSAGHRDFTGQETIPAVGLVNMNGRVYDPVIGRFLSPDPNIQTPGDLQNYNRYSYALNNPLRYTDPTGYDFWDDLGSYFSNPVNVAELVLSIVACAASPALGCMVIGAEIALMNGFSAVAMGASFEQTALNIGIGVGISMITGGVAGALLGPGASPIWRIVAGSASAAAATAISDVIAGRSVGSDVLAAASISAVQGAATFGLQRVVALSQASEGGGGSGEQRLEAAYRKAIGSSGSSGAGVPDTPFVEYHRQFGIGVDGLVVDETYNKLRPEALALLGPIFKDYGFDPSKVEFEFGWTPEGTLAYTVGDSVTLNENAWGKLNGLDRLELIAHEMTHSVQFGQLGLLPFGFRYAFEYNQTTNYDVPAALRATPFPFNVVDPQFTLDQSAERMAMEVGWRYGGQ